jgi:hypothetical protein
LACPVARKIDRLVWGISKAVGSKESLERDENNGHAGRMGRRSNEVNGVGKIQVGLVSSKFIFE